MKAEELQTHMLTTYTNLRWGMAVIGIALPLLLAIGGYVYGLSFQDSMSAYYHANQNDRSLRDVFVGLLCAMGLCLYLYKGYTERENYALNAAGILVIGVAVFPMEWNCGAECRTITLHGICAVAFFLCIAYVCIWRSGDTLKLLPSLEQQQRYRRVYLLLGIGMILSPVIALLFSLLLQRFTAYVFFVEAAGVWIFALYWLIKSRELLATKAEDRALRSQLELPVEARQ